MKIEIYDPHLTAPVGVCGPGVDPELVRIYDTLRQIIKQAPEVALMRYGLATEPEAFQGNPAVSDLLENEGPDCLPLTFVDNKLLRKGTYPDNEQLHTILRQGGYSVTFSSEKSCRAGCC